MLKLTRVLHLTNPLQHGPDVAQVQALLTSKGFPCHIDSIFGPQTGEACVNAKRALRYVKAKQIPTCGQPLVDRLEQHAPFPPPAPLPPEAARVRYLIALQDALHQKANWDYAEVRPIPHPPQHGRIVTDCSGSVTYLAQLAGCPDPNGRHYDGEGYTGTLLNACQHITRAMLQPGDLVVFGAFPGHHVCAVLQTGPDPLLFSHGHQGDPSEIRLSAMAAGQPPGITYLRFLP